MVMIMDIIIGSAHEGEGRSVQQRRIFPSRVNVKGEKDVGEIAIHNKTFFHRLPRYQDGKGQGGC